MTALKSDAASGAKLIDLMVTAIEQMNRMDGLNPVFYMPRVVRAYLRQQITNKSNVFLSMGEVAGKSVVTFDGIPCRRVDALSLNESTIS